MITNEEQAILRHTSDTGRYLTGGSCRDFVVCQALAAEGLLHDHGPQRLADGDHYYTTTMRGREALNEWQRAQPKPVAKKDRTSRAFAAWRRYRDATYDRMGFSEFWKLFKANPEFLWS